MAATLKVNILVDDKGTPVIQNFGKNAEVAISGLGKAALTSAAAIAGPLAAAFSVATISQYVKEATLANARFTTMGIVMETVGKNTGYTYTELEHYEKALRASGIAATETRSVMTKMMQANIELADSQRLARIAQDAAVIGNLNSSEAFENMIHGIQSGQIEVLRTMGINVNFEQSYKKLATQLNKTTDDLSNNEKMQARLNAVYEQAVNIQGVYEASMGTAGKQLKSLERYHEDIKITVGETFNETLVVGVQLYTAAIKDILKEVDSLKKSGQLKEWGRDAAHYLAAIVDLSRVVGANIGLLSSTFGASAMQIGLAASAMWKAAKLDFSGAAQDLQDMKAVGDKWAQDVASVWNMEIGKTGRLVDEMIAKIDKDAARAEKIKKETATAIPLPYGQHGQKDAPLKKDPTKEEIKKAHEAAELKIRIAEWENEEQFRADVAAAEWKEHLRKQEEDAEIAMLGRMAEKYEKHVEYQKSVKEGAAEQAQAYRRLYDDLGIMTEENYRFQLEALEKERQAYMALIDDEALVDQWYNQKKRGLDIQQLKDSTNLYDNLKGLSLQFSADRKKDFTEVAEAWARGEDFKATASQLAKTKIIGYASEMAGGYFDKLTGLIGEQIGAWIGLGTSQSSTDGKDWKQRLMSAAGYLAGIVVSMQAAKKVNNMADGGWLGTHAGGGMIRQGSGVRDDVFLGMTHGGSVANFGMGGEFVVNKKATAAWLPVLEAINAKGHADGGPLGDPRETANMVNGAGFGTFLDELGKSRNWKKAVVQAIIYYAGAFGSSMMGKAMGPDLFAEGGLIGRRNFKFGGLFDNKITRAVDKINSALGIDKLPTSWGLDQLGRGLWESNFLPLKNSVDAALIPFYTDIFTPGKSVDFSSHPERQVEAIFEAFKPKNYFSLGGLIPSYAAGTDYVPRTGPAILHEGERVTPKNANRPTIEINSPLLVIQGNVLGNKAAIDDLAIQIFGGLKRIAKAGYTL